MAVLDEWDEDLARRLADDEEVPELKEQHWQVLHYLRRCYASTGEQPALKRLCRDLRLPLRQLYELFPTGPLRGAWRIAGLPPLPGPALPLVEVRRRSALRVGPREVSTIVRWS